MAVFKLTLISGPHFTLIELFHLCFVRSITYLVYRCIGVDLLFEINVMYSPGPTIMADVRILIQG